MQLWNLNRMVSGSRHSTDTVDVVALMDRKLTLSENRRNISNQIGISTRHQGREQHELRLVEATRERARRANKSYQVGVSNEAIDRTRKALPPGRRVSSTGHIYYEHRANRSDKPPGWI